MWAAAPHAPLYTAYRLQVKCQFACRVPEEWRYAPFFPSRTQALCPFGIPTKGRVKGNCAEMKFVQTFPQRQDEPYRGALL